jgi:hypothetical protein
MEGPTLSDTIRAAHTYGGNRLDTVPISRGFSAVSDYQVDDPMDLSAAERRELFSMMKSFSSSGSFRGRSGFRGRDSRGSHLHRGTRGGSSGSSSRAAVQCYNCEDFGHYQGDCPLEKRSQLNYMEDGENNDSYDEVENKIVDYSSYLYCALPTSKSYVDSLLIDDNMIQKDVQFILNAGETDTKLPLYRALVNGSTCSVLIDSGTSANYISPLN